MKSRWPRSGESVDHRIPPMRVTLTAVYNTFQAVRVKSVSDFIVLVDGFLWISGIFVGTSWFGEFNFIEKKSDLNHDLSHDFLANVTTRNLDELKNGWVVKVTPPRGLNFGPVEKGETQTRTFTAGEPGWENI